MTVLHLAPLALEPGDVRRERVRVHFDDIALGGQTFRLEPADVDADVTLQATGDGLYMKLAFDTELVGPCFRCLEDARVPLSVRATEYGRRDAVPAGDDDELASEYLGDDRLDVGQWARDAVALATPEKILCRDDCGGLCPHCGIRLDAGTEHDCGEHQPDTRWAKLRELL